ncbi:MAG: beta-galactosidase [Muribaculaceae bacterium]|nr:beta-galactosidase [Muribaculaceae bacterium]
MKLRKFVIGIIALLGGLNLNAQNSQSSFKYPTPGEITICASTPIPDGIEPTRQAYLDLISCGFNMGMTNGNIDYFKKQFELIGDLNFKYMIQNGDLFSDKRDIFIKAFKDVQNFGGWKFKDEPSFESLKELQSQYHAMYEADPSDLIYINMAGVVGNYFTGPYPTLYEYLEYFQKMFNPEVWSYDFYPILIRNGNLIVEYETFYSALEAFSAISRKTGKPFWAYCESMAYKASSYSRPAANEAYLRFEAFSALAYGAQGIVYWTYGQRTPQPTEQYQSALVNLNGKKSRAWFAAQKVNKEIKKFNDVFYRCNVLEVRHTGDKIYKNTKKLSGEFGPFKMIRSGDAGVLVSFIENKGSKYIILVSRDVFNKQKITLELKNNKKVMNITSSKDTQYSWRKDVNITLDKGGYVIFKEI